MKTQKMIIEISERTFLEVMAAVAKATPMHPCGINPNAKVFPVGKPKIEPKTVPMYKGIVLDTDFVQFLKGKVPNLEELADEYYRIKHD